MLQYNRSVEVTRKYIYSDRLEDVYYCAMLNHTQSVNMLMTLAINALSEEGTKRRKWYRTKRGPLTRITGLQAQDAITETRSG